MSASARPLEARDPLPESRPETARVVSVDLVRGGVMVLMALDHARWFFSDVRFAPEDVLETTLPLFLTRWVTHFCAPVFFLLAGASAALSARRRGAADVARNLAARGLLLVVLELTLVGFAWEFRPGSSFAGVIWCLGASMLALAALVHVPRGALAALALAAIAGHDLLDGVDPRSLGSAAWIWRLLHAPGNAALPWGGAWFVLFPLVPWFAVMALGYALGPWFARSRDERRRLLAVSGAVAAALFVVLRATNLYGNPPGSFMPGGPGHFRAYPGSGRTLIAFLDTEKYPPSLQYLLMTLGPALLALAALDREPRGRAAEWIATFGRVPFFFYVLHLYLIHLAALALGVALGQPWQWLGTRGGDPPAGYGYPLGVVWLVWIGAVAALYPPCAWFARVKARGSSRWLRLL